MAVEIVAINPGKGSGRSKKRKGVKKVAKKKSGTKKKRRRNPSLARRTGRRVYSRARSTLAGMNIKGALANTLPHVAGALAAKWAVKKFPGVEGGSDSDPNWTWGNYLAGGIGAFVAGAIAENIKKGYGQKVLEGGLTLLGYKIFENEIASKNDWLADQFGQDDYEVLMGDEQPGDMMLGDDGEIYMLGADGRTRPIRELHRMMQPALLQQQQNRALAGPLVKPGVALGGPLVKPTVAMGDAFQPFPAPGTQRNFRNAYQMTY